MSMITFMSLIPNSDQIQDNKIPIWGDNTVAPMNGGFVDNLTTQIIFSPTAAGDRVFNHHTRMCVVDNRVYLTRSTQDFREDGGGQYSLFTYSDDLGITWQPWNDLIAQGSDMYDENPIVNGVTIWPHYTFNYNGKAATLHLFIDRNAGWNNALVSIIDNGVITDKFYLFDNGAQPVVGSYPVYTYDSIQAPGIIAAIEQTTNIPWYAANNFGYPWSPQLMEFSGIVNPTGFEAVIMRDLGNGRYDKTYSYRDNNSSSWSTVSNINIPDCVSGSTTVWKRYGDNVYVSGNDAKTGTSASNYRVNYFISKAKYWDLNFTEAKEIVRGMTPDIQYPGTNKNGGLSYCDFVILNGKVIHAGSRGKEDIYIHTFDEF